jgi:hypothetical protein
MMIDDENLKVCFHAALLTKTVRAVSSSRVIYTGTPFESPRKQSSYFGIH